MIGYPQKIAWVQNDKTPQKTSKNMPQNYPETIDPKKVELYNHGKHTLNH